MKIVALIAALALAPAALADPIPTDAAAPVVSDLHVTPRHALRFSVSEYALVHVTVRHRGDRMQRVERAFMPGAARIWVGRGLPRGSYTATITANDVAHNYSPAQVVRFRIG